jgi:hypothetical protein
VRIRFPEAARILAAAAVLCAACFGFLGAGETALAVGKLVSSWQLFPATAGALRGAVEAISVSAGGAAGAGAALGAGSSAAGAADWKRTGRARANRLAKAIRCRRVFMERSLKAVVVILVQ